MRRLAAAAALVLLTGPGAAQVEPPTDPACAMRATVHDSLGRKHGESRRFAAIGMDQAIWELWANARTGTWTLLRLTPDGRACVRAVGSHFDDTPQVEGEPT